jgi:hypothetical protein
MIQIRGRKRRRERGEASNRKYDDMAGCNLGDNSSISTDNFEERYFHTVAKSL